MSLWSVLPSPLIFGGNETKLSGDTFTLSLLTNEEVIAVDQDIDGNKGKRISNANNQQIWTKDLSGGRKAVAFFNRGGADVAMSATLTQLGVTAPVTARDLWQRKDLAAPTTSINVTVPYKGAALILLSPPASSNGGAGGAGGAGGTNGVGGTFAAGSAGAPASGGGGATALPDGGTAGALAAGGAAGLDGGSVGSAGTPPVGASGAPPVGAAGSPPTGGSGSSAVPTRDSGCSCRLGASDPQPRSALMLLAAAAALGSLRRRRRGNVAPRTLV
jgi:alpha-galactosidase